MQTTSSADLGLGASIATAFAAVAGVHSADRPLCAGLSPLTSNHITRVQQALARSQAHMTFETTVGLHRRLHVPMVHESLSQAAERQSARQAQLSNEETYLASPDWLERISQALQQSRACVLSETMLNTVTTAQSNEHHATDPLASQSHAPGNLPLDIADWPCPQCTYQAPSFRLLRVHLSRVAFLQGEGSTSLESL